MKLFLFFILAGSFAFAQEKPVSLELAYYKALNSEVKLSDRLEIMATLLDIVHNPKTLGGYNERTIQTEILNEFTKGYGLLYLPWAQSKAAFDVVSKIASRSDLDINLAMSTLFPQLTPMIRESVDELYFVQEGVNNPNVLTTDELKNFFQTAYPKLDTRNKVKLLRSIFSLDKRIVSRLFPEIAKTIRVQTEAEMFLDILSQTISTTKDTLLISDYLVMVSEPNNKNLFKSEDAFDIRRKIAFQIRSSMPTLRKSVHQDYFSQMERGLAQELDILAKNKPVTVVKNKPLPLYKRILNFLFGKKEVTCAKLFAN